MKKDIRCRKKQHSNINKAVIEMEKNEILEINNLLKTSESNDLNSSSDEIEHQSDYDNFILFSTTNNEQLNDDAENKTQPPNYVKYFY